jgi:hypothetical protein
MDALEDRSIHARCGFALVPEPVTRGELALDRDDPVRALGVGPGVVLERRRVM